MDRQFYKAVKFYTFWAIVLTLLIGSCIVASAEPIDESQAIRAIIGEASNQGAEGMLAIAYGIRNRGTLKGVYGVRAKHVDNEPQYVWDRAKSAWLMSGKFPSRDITKGATHWENVKAFGKPYWADALTKTVLIGAHQFYK